MSFFRTADLDTYINERQEIPQEEPGKNMAASRALRSYAPWAGEILNTISFTILKLIQATKSSDTFEHI